MNPSSNGSTTTRRTVNPCAKLTGLAAAQRFQVTGNFETGKKGCPGGPNDSATPGIVPPMQAKVSKNSPSPEKSLSLTNHTHNNNDFNYLKLEPAVGFEPTT